MSCIRRVLLFAVSGICRIRAARRTAAPRICADAAPVRYFAGNTLRPVSTSKVPAKRRKSTPAKKTASAPPPAQRQQEVLGLVLMAFGVLLSLALITYSPADDALARRISVLDAFSPSGSSAENWLGLLGAELAYGLIPNLLGYPIVALALLVVGWGYVLLRQRRPGGLAMATVLTTIGVFLTSTFAGWAALRAEADWPLASGTVGRGVAGWMGQVFGASGTLILLLLAGAITALLFVDRDIQVTLDRLEEFAFRVREGFRDWLADYKVRRAEAAEHRAAQAEERRAQREAQQADREAARAEAADARAAKREDRSAAAPPAAAASPAAAAPPAAAPPPARPPAPVTAPPRAPEPPAAVPIPPIAAAPAAAPPPPEHQAIPPPAGDGIDHAEVPAVNVVGPVEEEEADIDRRPAGALAAAARDLPYVFPSIELLTEADPRQGVDLDEIEANKQILLDKLETYKVAIDKVDAAVGPTVTRYELTPAAGVKISRITALEDDLAMAMAAPGIRIVAPIPGKSAIGVEIPNRSRELVRLRQMLAIKKFQEAAAGGMALPVPIGKTIEGEVFMQDLAKMPHLLIAGATGSGKSVGLNALVCGLLYACHPADLKLVMIDPKKIELNLYATLLEHFVAMPSDSEEPIITDFMQAAGVLRSCEREMENRYDLLAEAGVRGIEDYNKKVASGKLSGEDGHRHLPYVVVLIDELADLMMTAGKEVEPPIARLAQMARAVGIHLVIATQRPSVDVITGLIKANFPSRMAFQVASSIDSRTTLDRSGAERLIGNGDLLYMNGSRVTRLQGPFVSSEEIEEVCAHIARQDGAGPYRLPPMEPESSGPSGLLDADDSDRDDLFDDAARVIVRSQQGSVSLLQRKLSVGYTRAARLVDQLEDAGIVGAFEGSKARQVLVETESQLDALLAGAPAPLDLDGPGDES